MHDFLSLLYIGDADADRISFLVYVLSSDFDLKGILPSLCWRNGRKKGYACMFWMQSASHQSAFLAVQAATNKWTCLCYVSYTSVNIGNAIQELSI
jgi:hypothetical protein